MQVLFETHDPRGAALRELAQQRLRFTMRRMAWLVPRAFVRLSDDNGPRGGVDKRVQVELRTAGTGTVVITAVARDWRSALDSALARAAKALVRLLRRSRAAQRRPAPTA